MQKIKIYQPAISAITGLLFIVCSILCVNEYKGFTKLQKKLNSLTLQEKNLTFQLNERKRQQKLIDKTSAFVHHVIPMGLFEDNWSKYNVNIEKDVSFQEFSLYLQQCSGSESYYFIPEQLHFEKLTDTSDTKKKVRSLSGSEGLLSGDAKLKLNGFFIVKNQ